MEVSGLEEGFVVEFEVMLGFVVEEGEVGGVEGGLLGCGEGVELERIYLGFHVLVSGEGAVGFEGVEAELLLELSVLLEQVVCVGFQEFEISKLVSLGLP